MRGHRTSGVLFIGFAKLQNGITDAHLGVHDHAVWARHANSRGGIEGRNEEVDESWRPVDEEVGCYVREVGTAELGRFLRYWCGCCGFGHGGSPLQIGL